MYRINLQFTVKLSNEGTCTGLQLDTLTDELMFSFSSAMVQVNGRYISYLSYTDFA